MMLGIMAGMLQKDSCPRRTENWNLLGDDVVLFYGPLYLDVTCSSCLPEEYMLLLFREMTSGMVSVFSTLLGSTADTCIGISLRGFLEKCLTSLVLHVLGWFYWLRCTSRYFPSGVAKPKMLCILAGMDQKDCYDMVHIVQTANCGVSAVAVHRWSSTSLSRCRGSLSWSRQFVRP